MKAYKHFSKSILLCVLLACVLLVTASAATWEEMQENGAVSDGGVRLGDARDGIVSDVSETGENGIIGDIITKASDAIDDGLDGLMGTQDTGRIDSAPQTTTVPDATSGQATADMTGTSDTAGSAANGEQDGGMSAGIIIAVLVVVAVVAVIFLLIPKRKR